MQPIDIFAAFIAILLGALFLFYQVWGHRNSVQTRETTEYIPLAAWLRAGVFFCLFYLISWATGTLELILTTPLATPAQLTDRVWWLWVAGLTTFILFAYWGVWAHYTIRFDRKVDLVPQILFGLLWGTALGQMLASIWGIVIRIKPAWELWQQWLLTFVVIGVIQWLLMDMYWDIYISPEHDSPRSIRIKTLCTHIPNVTLCLIFLAMYGNILIFVSLQTLALVGCSINMRMPAPWSQERTPPARRALSIFWGLPRCGGYISDNPKNDPYLKAAHLD
jgi:hypothetical protein